MTVPAVTLPWDGAFLGRSGLGGLLGGRTWFLRLLGAGSVTEQESVFAMVCPGRVSPGCNATVTASLESPW